MKFVEFCAGIGGMRAGLTAAGWDCVLAIDNDPDAIEVHRLAFGEGMQVDIGELAPIDIPNVDAWVAGFPCQPFSSSGNRLGFGHTSGNVFEHIVRLAEAKLPSVLLLENVEGLLNNKSGHTFSNVLRRITDLGYEADWLLLDLRWFGVPQSRPRLFVVATREGKLNRSPLSPQRTLQLNDADDTNFFGPLVQRFGLESIRRPDIRLSITESRLRPAIGKAHPNSPSPFRPLGRASGDVVSTYDVRCTSSQPLAADLGSIVAPSLAKSGKIRSGRYYARGTPTALYLRVEPISHCVGTSLGGAPLFALPISELPTKHDRNRFLERANWSREEKRVLVMRLRPEYALLLYGPHTTALHEAVKSWKGGDTRKYKLVGNMVAPVCAKAVADMISSIARPSAAANGAKRKRAA